MGNLFWGFPVLSGPVPLFIVKKSNTIQLLLSLARFRGVERERDRDRNQFFKIVFSFRNYSDKPSTLALFLGKHITDTEGTQIINNIFN